MTDTTTDTSAEKPAIELDDMRIAQLERELEAFEASQARQPQPQPQQQAEPANETAAADPALRPKIEGIEGVSLGVEDVLAGAMTKRDARGREALASTDQLDEELEAGNVAAPRGRLLRHKTILAAGVALAIGGYLLLPTSRAPAPAAPAAVATPTPTPTPAPAPTPHAPAPPGPGAPAPALDTVGPAMGQSPQAQGALAAEMDRQLKAIPPAEQQCSNPALTTYEQRQCVRYSPQLFFKCTEGSGQRWNVLIPGCEQV